MNSKHLLIGLSVVFIFACNSNRNADAATPSAKSQNSTNIPEAPVNPPDMPLMPAANDPNAAQEVFFVTPQTGPLNINRPLHLITVGEGSGGIDELFQVAAITRARRYMEAFPDHNVIVQVLVSGIGTEKDERLWLQTWRMNIITSLSEWHGMSDLVNFILPFKQIKSWDHFSHSNKAANSILPVADDTLLFPLRDRLTTDAYIILHGCNSGWRLAPYLMRILGVAAAGALTFADFETLHSVGNFFPDMEGVYPAGPWATTNTLSFSSAKSCARGACLRMKPSNAPYDGMYGVYPTGLPFFKFFCPSGRQPACEKAMALSLLAFPDLMPLSMSSKKDDFKRAARDWLCPMNKTQSLRSSCIQQLQKSETSQTASEYSPFQGPTADCNWQGCSESLPATASAIISEYKAYVRGISQIVAK